MTLETKEPPVLTESIEAQSNTENETDFQLIEEDTHSFLGETEQHPEVTYQRADGTIERAQNAQDAITRCPYLGRLALMSPDQANLLVELASIGSAKIEEEKNISSAKLTNSPSINFTDTKAKPFVEEVIDIDVAAKSTKITEIAQINPDINETIFVDKLNNVEDEIAVNDRQKPTPENNHTELVEVHENVHEIDDIEATDTETSFSYIPDEIKKEIIISRVEEATKIPITDAIEYRVNHEEIIQNAQNEVIAKQPISEQPLSGDEIVYEVSEFYTSDDAVTSENQSLTEPKEIGTELATVTDSESTEELNVEYQENEVEINDLIQAPEAKNTFIESVNDQPLEQTLEVLTGAASIPIERAQEIAIRAVVNEIPEVLEILKEQIKAINDKPELGISEEVFIKINELVQKLGYDDTEKVFIEYMQDHSIEQLHNLLCGLYKAYSEDEKKELFAKTFTNLQYVNDSKIKISKHLFRLMVQGKLFSTTAN